MDDQNPNPESPDSETADGTEATPAGADDDVNKDLAPEFELVTITYLGRSWNVPKDRGLWDMNVQFEFEEGRRLIGTLILLGGSPENIQPTKQQVYSICRTNREVDAFMDHCAEVLNKECTG